MPNHVHVLFRLAAGERLEDVVRVLLWIQPDVSEFFEINSRTVDYIKSKGENDNTKIINLVKTIEKIAEDKSTDPYLIMLSERARAVQEKYEDRQITTQATLDELLALIEENTKRNQEQTEKGFDGLTFFVYRTHDVICCPG